MKTIAANDDDDDEVVGCERLSLSKHAANCCEEEEEEVDVQDDDVHDHLSLSSLLTQIGSDLLVGLVLALLRRIESRAHWIVDCCS